MDCLVRRSEKMGGTIQAAANTEVLVTTGCQRERGNCMNDKRGMRQYIRVVFAIMDVGKSPKQWARGQIRSGVSSAQLKHPSGPTANPSAPSFQLSPSWFHSLSHIFTTHAQPIRCDRMSAGLCPFGGHTVPLACPLSWRSGVNRVVWSSQRVF